MAAGLLRRWLGPALDPAYAGRTAILLILLDIVLTFGIVAKVPYTEIDWKAYMQEVEGVVNGTYDYMQLAGDTGPLVYPAGFVYIYTGFYFGTDRGTNIALAQNVFVVLYLVTLALVLAIYRRTKLPPLAMVPLTLIAYRVHSIFVLRLFNDPIAMLLLYLSVNLLLARRWTLACAAFSLAVSVKMNILLFAPGLFFILLAETGIIATVARIALCGAIQLALAVPFLLVNPWGYITRSFDLGRQFFYIWTVNWKIVSEETFLDRRFHVALLALHVTLLFVFCRRWINDHGGLGRIARGGMTLTSAAKVWILFGCNLIGVACARSLHYQFYVWYFHTLPWLLWSVRLPFLVRIALPLAVEYCWIVFPATPLSSGLLAACHVVLVGALLAGPTRPHVEQHIKKE